MAAPTGHFPIKGYGKSAHHVSVHGPRGVHPKGGPQPPFVWSVSRRGDFQGEREIEIPLPLNGVLPPLPTWAKEVGPQAEIFRQGQSPCPTVSPSVKNFGFATSLIRVRLRRAATDRPYGVLQNNILVETQKTSTGVYTPVDVFIP